MVVESWLDEFERWLPKTGGLVESFFLASATRLLELPIVWADERLAGREGAGERAGLPAQAGAGGRMSVEKRNYDHNDVCKR